jgi:hypothetical protein
MSRQSPHLPLTTRLPRSITRCRTKSGPPPQDGPTKVTISRRGSVEHPIYHASSEPTALQKVSHPLNTIQPPLVFGLSVFFSDATFLTVTNKPTKIHSPQFRHVLNCLVQNEPGVLSRVSGILTGRGFNVRSTLTLWSCAAPIFETWVGCASSGQDGVVEQARRQLEDLVRYVTFLPTYFYTSLLNNPYGGASFCVCHSGACVARFRLYRDTHDLARIASR